MCGREEGARIRPLIKGCLVWVSHGWSTVAMASLPLDAPAWVMLLMLPSAVLGCLAVPVQGGWHCSPHGFGDSHITGQKALLQPQGAPLENKCMASRQILIDRPVHQDLQELLQWISRRHLFLTFWVNEKKSIECICASVSTSVVCEGYVQ